MRLTDADAGRTVTVAPGTRLEVRLAGPGGSDVWSGLERTGPGLHLVRYDVGADGLAADLDALAPAAAQTLTATTDAACSHASAACARPSRGWQVQVAVTDGPADTSAVPCTPGPRPTASAAPGSVVLTQADDGRTVDVPRDGVVTVQLDGCDEPAWLVPTATGPLFRVAAQLDRARGQVQAVLRPVEPGTATVTARTDARCAHTTPACTTQERTFSATVRVTGASAYPCTKPVYEGFEVHPDRVAAGDAVTVTGGRDDLCVDDASEPVRDFRLLATPEGGVQTEVASTRATSFRAEVHPDRTTTYRLLMDGASLRPVGSPTAVVDRTSGSCTGLVLRGPARAVAGSTVVLTGTAPGTSTVTVLFRRRGETAFRARRALEPGPDGRVSTSYVAQDDYRWYAATPRCDSTPGLTQAVPVVTGPAVVHRGDTVTLHVQAPVGVRTLLFFRGAGEPFAPRRAFTGPGTTTYVARDDQRYYLGTPSVQGPARLTQVR